MHDVLSCCIHPFSFSLKFLFLSILSLLSLSPFTFLISQVTVVVPIFMGTIPIYTTTQSMLFSLFTFIFTNHFFCCKHLALQCTTHYLLAICRWVQSHYLGFVTNFLALLVMASLPYTITSHSLSLPKIIKPSLIIFVFIHQHASDGSHLPSSHFGKDVFSVRHIPKSGLNKIPNLGHFLTPLNHTFYISSIVSPAPLTWLGCKTTEPPTLLRLSFLLVRIFSPSCYSYC